MIAPTPSGWITSTLGDCCTIVSGGTPKREKPEYWDGTIPWVTPKDISNLDRPDFFDPLEKISDFGLKKSSATLLPTGAVLLSSRAPIGLLAIAGQPMATNQGFKSLIPGPELDSRFLYYAVQRLVPVIQERGSGATFKEVSKSVVSEIPISYPRRLEEQERIAAILDKAADIRRKRERTTVMVDEFIASGFLRMFGNPVTNPPGWHEGIISDCLVDIVGGWSAKGDARAADKDEMGVLKISAVTSGEYRPFENKFVATIPREKALVIPQVGDLLFSRANTRELAAATCIVLEAPQNVFLPDKLWRLDINRSIGAAPYLKFVLGHPEYRRILCTRATGTSGSMLNISMTKLLEHPIPIPPIEQQKQFSNLWHAAKRMALKVKKQEAVADLLLASLTQRAFRGEL